MYSVVVVDCGYQGICVYCGVVVVDGDGFVGVVVVDGDGFVGVVDC